jgi:hypothetical protein
MALGVAIVACALAAGTCHAASDPAVSLPVRTGVAAIQISYVRQTGTAPLRRPHVTGTVL